MASIPCSFLAATSAPCRRRYGQRLGHVGVTARALLRHARLGGRHRQRLPAAGEPGGRHVGCVPEPSLPARGEARRGEARRVGQRPQRVRQRFSGVDETALPLRPQVKGACEILGLDPLYLANQGKRENSLLSSEPGTRASLSTRCDRTLPGGIRPSSVRCMKCPRGRSFCASGWAANESSTCSSANTCRESADGPWRWRHEARSGCTRVVRHKRGQRCVRLHSSSERPLRSALAADETSEAASTRSARRGDEALRRWRLRSSQGKGAIIDKPRVDCPRRSQECEARRPGCRR